MSSKSKNIKRLSALLLVAGLAIWVAARWHVWFGNAPEVEVDPFMAPAHVLLTFGDKDEMSRNVSWQCDTIIHPSWLELVSDGDTARVQAQGEVFESRNGKAAYYVSRLRQLKPDCRYRYRAVCPTDPGIRQSPSRENKMIKPNNKLL